MTFFGFKSFLKKYVFLYFLEVESIYVPLESGKTCQQTVDPGFWLPECVWGCPEGVERAWRKENLIFEELSMRRYSQIFSFLSNSLSSQSYSLAKCPREDQKVVEIPKWGLQSALRVQDWEQKCDLDHKKCD